jgi:hypothetical protein
MRSTTNVALGSIPLGVLAALCWLSGFCAQAPAQTGKLGQNAVCTAAPCSPTIGTSAFVDAYVVSTTLNNPNLCGLLNTILKVSNGFLTSAGGVIDARGLNSNNVNMTCSASPWAGITGPPTNILLPAGTIVIPTPWVLPPQTHLIGQGDNPASGTVIQACTSTTCTHSFSGTAMIQFCSASACLGVSVEKLILDGQGRQSNGSYISGIFNQYSQASYVDPNVK